MKYYKTVCDVINENSATDAPNEKYEYYYKSAKPLLPNEIENNLQQQFNKYPHLALSHIYKTIEIDEAVFDHFLVPVIASA